MARPLRLEFPGAFYHVMARGNERKEIFRDEQDYERFLFFLGQTHSLFGFRIHAYALMPNHYHLLLETPRAELSRGMHRLNGLFSQYFNARHERIGHLFQGRFKALLVEKNAYWLRLSRYIHQNPVKAGLAVQPWEHAWNSSSQLLGLEPVMPWLCVLPTLQLFSEADQRLAYKQFLIAQTEADPGEASIGQTLLGSPEFIEEMRKKADPLLKDGNEYSFAGCLAARPSADAVVAAVRRSLSPPLSKGAELYLLKEKAGLRLRELAARYSMGNSGVCQAVSRFKDRIRRDEWLHSRLTRIEEELSDCEK